MTRDDMILLADTVARAHGVDPALVKAVCHYESANWQTWATRFEPRFFERYIKTMKGISISEMHARATSWGLMQVMGQVAREYGFAGRFLAELCDPATGIEYGVRKFGRELARNSGDIRKTLLAYNGGGDAGYPARVLAYVDSYRIETA